MDDFIDFLEEVIDRLGGPRRAASLAALGIASAYSLVTFVRHDVGTLLLGLDLVAIAKELMVLPKY